MSYGVMVSVWVVELYAIRCPVRLAVFNALTASIASVLCFNVAGVTNLVKDVPVSTSPLSA